MKSAFAGIVLATIAFASRGEGQALYAGIRGGVGVPTGDFSQTTTATGSAAFLHGASPGLGYGLDAGLGSGLVGFYGSYDRIQFDCKSEACSTSGKYRLTGYAAGVRVGVPLLPLFKPWAKAGITYNELVGSNAAASPTRISTGKSFGYEIGGGVDIPILMGFFSLTPQVRYIRQKLDPNSSGKRPADYYTFDIGLRARSPI